MKRLLGVLIALTVGFVLFCLAVGFGALVAFVTSNIHPATIVLGSVLCGAGYVFYLLEKDK